MNKSLKILSLAVLLSTPFTASHAGAPGTHIIKEYERILALPANKISGQDQKMQALWEEYMDSTNYDDSVCKRIEKLSRMISDKVNNAQQEETRRVQAEYEQRVLEQFYDGPFDDFDDE